MFIRQRSNLIFPALLFLLLWGCKKDPYTCSHSYYYVPAQVGFVGFSAPELELIIVNRYKAGSNFDSLLTTDTLDGSSSIVKGDTMYYKIDKSFFTVSEGADFKVSLPNAGKEFRITEVRSFEKEYTWTQKEHCAMGASQTSVRPFAFKLNGQDYPAYDSQNSWYIFLRK